MAFCHWKRWPQVAKTLEEDMVRALDDWSLEPVVRALRALRGVELVVGMTVMAEVGDITRFDSPTQLMACVGQVPSEHSTTSARMWNRPFAGRAGLPACARPRLMHLPASRTSRGPGPKPAMVTSLRSNG